MEIFSVRASALVVVLFLPLIISVCHGGNVLVYPIEGSHWINMKILIEALHAQGHNITIIRSDKSWYIEEKSPLYSSITIPVEEAIDEEFVKKMIIKGLEIQRGNSSVINFLSMQIEMFGALGKAHGMVANMIETIFKDSTLTKRIQESQYDLLLTDPCWGGGTLVAKYFNLPLVYNVRWLPIGEAHFAIAPSPISYIPLTGSGFSDKMTFTERVRNVIFYLFTVFNDVYVLRPLYQHVCHQYLGPDVEFYSLMQAADLWLMRVDFVFEFPRPTMPNVVYIGGFHCRPAKPLPQDLEEFVQSSEEHGIIIMSTGAFVGGLPNYLAEEVAAAFAQMPQKVIWRHTGERPENLGNNTLLVQWFPQNDLLGHPKTRVFVAHGGTNGVQEAIYHGMPVLGIPLFFDQYDNLLRLESRGGAKILDVATLNKDIFLQALQELVNEPSYRMNMQRLSSLHLDQPMKPLDLAMFWIEFVMRHKGAAHLRTESYRMPWYAYHSVDVIMVLLAAVFIILLTAVAIIRFLCCRACRAKKIKSE